MFSSWHPSTLVYAVQWYSLTSYLLTQAGKLSKEAQRVSKDAAKLVPKDVQQAA